MDNPITTNYGLGEPVLDATVHVERATNMEIYNQVLRSGATAYYRQPGGVSNGKSTKED